MEAPRSSSCSVGGRSVLWFLCLLCFSVAYTFTMCILNDHGTAKALFQRSQHDTETLSEPADDNGTAASERSGARRPRILCWVVTSPANHWTKAVHVRNTWGTRCDSLVFMSSEEDAMLPAVRLPVSGESRRLLWGKTKAALRHLYAHHLHSADWFLKVDDDTYVLVEKLRLLVADHDPAQLIYFGRRLKDKTKNTSWKPEDVGERNASHQEFPSGGAGYVLSRGALKRLVEVGVGEGTGLCPSTNVGDEDVEVGRCLRQVGVRVVDSRDEFERERFHPLPPKTHMVMGMLPTWFYELNLNPITEGPGCCSDDAISFHYIDPSMMHVLEYLIYHLKPHGLSSRLTRPLEEDVGSQTLREGNNEQNSLGTGDHILVATGHHKPVATGDHIPAATGNHIPGATGDHVHAVTGDNIRVMTGNHIHAATGDHIPVTTGNHIPAATGDHIHAVTGDHIRAATGNHIPAATGDHIHAVTGDHIPAATGNHIPIMTGNHILPATGNHRQEATGDQILAVASDNNQVVTGNHKPAVTGNHIPAGKQKQSNIDYNKHVETDRGSVGANYKVSGQSEGTGGQGKVYGGHTL